MRERRALLIAGGGARLCRNLRLVFGIHRVLGDADNGLLFFVASNQRHCEKHAHRRNAGNF